MNKTALVIIDVQNDYCHPEGVFAQKAKFSIESISNIYPNLCKLVSACRDKDIPVIWVKMIWDNDEEVGILANKSAFLKHEGLRRGTWGADIVSEMDVQPNDIIIEKKRFSAFYETELSSVLEKLGVKEIIVGGVRTDFCVESTVRDAFFRDYEVIIASDCAASYFSHFQEGSLRVMGTVFSKVLETEDIIPLLEVPKKV
jgi:ureidoacrylate peracid hydrolase